MSTTTTTTINIELVECKIINPENDQRAITSYIDKDDVNYETAKLQLTVTSAYHNFHNTTADAVACEVDKQATNDGDYNGSAIVIIEQALLEKYNTYISQFNQYGDRLPLSHGMTADEIREILTA